MRFKFFNSSNRMISAKPQRERYLMVFVTAFLAMLVTFIPSLIANKGIFIYYGDFNSQQIMFYHHAVEAVKEGNLAWDWGTDLGANFVGSYSFYLLGSPFFWLATLFPLSWAEYLLPWLLCLKTAVAALAAYAYIRRFVRSADAAFIGAMLYAFSGFQTYNVFFNHFHDATAFFPLLLLGFEQLTQDGRKGAFALPVALCASISYFFFVCEVIFVIIYFFIRCFDSEFEINFKIFGLLFLEAIIGVMISAVILLPAVIDVFTNPRVSSRLYGMDMAVYSENVRIPRIFQAFFMLSDMPARVNIFNSEKARWASMAGYLPMFSMCGVIAYMRTHKKNWATRIIWICIVMACVPILNSLYVLLNSSYYARWYYMPILIMCLMTAKVIDEDPAKLRKGFIPVAVVCAAFIGVGLLPTQDNDDETVYGKVAEYIELYYIQAIITALMVIMLFFAIYKLSSNKVRWTKTVTVMTTIACIICMTSSVLYGIAQGDDNEDYIERAINGSDNLDMEKLDADDADSENTFYRIDTSENVDNWCMFWGLSSMRTFHSVVPTSIMEFYDAIDQTRDVASRMDVKLYPLRSLFSVKYYFKELTQAQLDGAYYTPNQTVDNLSGFSYVDTQNGFMIYENENYIPMGFAYDTYLLDSNLEDLSSVQKTYALVDSLVLNTSQAKKYADIITHATVDSTKMTSDNFKTICNEKKAQSCYYFEYDTNGFDAKIELDSTKLVFFSIPYEDGWTAQVNGEDVEIEKVSYGFMAVEVPAGDSTITFTYKTAGLSEGKVISVVGVGLFAAYIAAGFALHRKKEF